MILNFHQKQRSRFYSYKGKYFVKIAHVYFSRHLLFNEDNRKVHHTLVVAFWSMFFILVYASDFFKESTLKVLNKYPS